VAQVAAIMVRIFMGFLPLPCNARDRGESHRHVES
jgi:hypothetical protein